MQVILPTNTSVMTKKDEACVREARRVARKQPKKNGLWRCYWNVDVRVPYGLVHRALERVVHDNERGVKALSANEDVCPMRKRGGLLIDGSYTCPQ